jgi:hypothetical protein
MERKLVDEKIDNLLGVLNWAFELTLTRIVHSMICSISVNKTIDESNNFHYNTHYKILNIHIEKEIQ